VLLVARLVNSQLVATWSAHGAVAEYSPLGQHLVVLAILPWASMHASTAQPISHHDDGSVREKLPGLSHMHARY
jgi:hypothetical protein